MSMRILLAFLGLLTLSAAAPVRDWTKTVSMAPTGAYVLGNPRAPVKLVEYASFTCSHCAAFSAESAGVLEGQMIRSGSTSLEFRHYVRDRLDLAAVMLARCTGPRGMFAATRAIFAAQSKWLNQAIQHDRTFGPSATLKDAADDSGLSAIVRARGLSEAAIAACLKDDAAIARVTAMTAAAPAEIPGTPTFYINGKMVPRTASWAGLEPALRAAGAK
ncbi:MAG TPA: thioredoxin domain-containing protein [Sphingomonas sp.]|jgi:protein-disulfide isomerase|nr:thioredoxin domain-containing protein [Sphingomonas sp.]